MVRERGDETTCVVGDSRHCSYGSNAKIRFQSFFMLMTVAPLNDADCEAVWKLIDVDNKGSINAEQAKVHVADFVQADVDKNGSIDATEFKAACKAGLVKK